MSEARDARANADADASASASGGASDSASGGASDSASGGANSDAKGDANASAPTTRAAWVGASLAVAAIALPVIGMLVCYVAPPPSLFGAAPALGASEVVRLALRSLGLGLVVAPVAVLGGTWLAWIQHRASGRWLPRLAALALIPLAVPSYLLAATWRHALGPGGPIGEALGVERAFSGFGAAALTLAIACVPYAQLIVLAALRRIPSGEEEAARVLGASAWRTFREVYLPRLRPAWALAFVLVTLYAIGDFGAVAVLDCEVLTYWLYRAVERGQLERALELGVGLLALAVPVLAAARILHGRVRIERPVARLEASGRRPLGGVARAAAGLALVVVLGLGAALPIATLVSWVAGGVAQGARFAPIAPLVRDSAMFAGAGALVCVALAIGPAWLGARRGGRRAAAFEHTIYLAGGLPAVLIGFGVLELKIGLTRLMPWRFASGEIAWEWLERSAALLVLAYAARFLATGLAAIQPVAARLDPRLDEAARTLGASRVQRLVRVTIPSLAPGLAAAYVLLFVTLLKELPITLLLAPIGRRTLAYRVYDGFQEAALADAGLAGLLLLGLALAAHAIVRPGRTGGLAREAAPSPAEAAEVARER